MALKKSTKKVLGWRERVSLPDLGVETLKVKVDSGARTSALHAEEITIVRHPRTGERRVRFILYPEKDKKSRIVARAPYVGTKKVRSSLGHLTERPVIETTLRVGDDEWPIEVTLVNRDIMGFRMLLGRSAIRHGFLIDPAHSYLLAGPRQRRRRSPQKG